MKLDAWDKKILQHLQHSNRLSQREIADLVSLSPSAVNRRIAALEEAGVVKTNVSIVDASKVGRPITIMVQVTIENERLDLLEEDKQRFVNCPQVQQVYYVTGDFDFLLVVNVRDMAEYGKRSVSAVLTAIYWRDPRSMAEVQPLCSTATPATR